MFFRQRRIGHFTLLVCGGRQRNVQRLITHVHSLVLDLLIKDSLNLLFSDVPVAVVVVGFLNSLVIDLVPGLVPAGQFQNLNRLILFSVIMTRTFPIKYLIYV